MLISAVVSLINLLIKALGGVAGVLLNLLPPSPFQLVQIAEIPFLAELNWILPFDLFLGILGYWLGAIVLYYIVQVALRWVKAIE